MGFEIKSAIICDGCGTRHDAAVECRSSHAQAAVKEVIRWAKRAGWMTMSRGRYYTQVHFCPSCADSGAAIPKAKRVVRG